MSILGKKCPTHTEAAQIIVFNLPFSKKTKNGRTITFNVCQNALSFEAS
jgi:hypothetical protein